MDLHIFADPDPGSQNLADPTDPDPDPKHWISEYFSPIKGLKSRIVTCHSINVNISESTFTPDFLYKILVRF